jgi:acyl-CoA synthetase (AMP-forming)/AMP-acid ligase II
MNGTVETLWNKVAAFASGPEAHREAVTDRTGTWSYSDLAGVAAHMSGRLLALAMEPGMAVSLQVPNQRSFVAAHLAIERLGAVSNPLLMQYERDHLRSIVATARPAAAFVVPEYRGRDMVAEWRDIAAHTGYPRYLVILSESAVLDVMDNGTSGEPRRFEDRVHGVPAVLIFTSGTVKAKGVLHTLDTLAYGDQQMASEFGLRPGDRIWMPSPVSHGTGLQWGVRLSCTVGATLVLQDRWDADDALDLLDMHPSKFTMSSATFLADLVSAAERSKRTVQLDYFVSAGSVLPPSLVSRAAAIGLDVLPAFGMTEHFVSLLVRPSDPADARSTSDGWPLDGTDVAVLLDDGTISHEPDAAGEMVVRGPGVVSGGYLDEPELTASTFRDDGWQRTGDLATIGERRLIRIVGRQKDLVIRGGVNIAPRPIEEALVTLDGIREATVVGTADDRLGERICAVVVPSREVGERRARDLAAELTGSGLPRFMLPEFIVVESQLPKTASGKIRKDVVRASLENRTLVPLRDVEL